LCGTVWGDKGYLLNKAKRQALEKLGTLCFVTPRRKNMKSGKATAQQQFRWLKKRAVVECVIASNKEEGNIEHTRHRSDANALTNVFAALVAHTFRERKPQVCAHKILEIQPPQNMKIAARFSGLKLDYQVRMQGRLAVAPALHT